jgi:Flp pilus assembly protein TadG
MPTSRLPRGDRGQAAVELVALLPLIVAGLLGAWQVVLAGHTAWSAHAAARAAARAHAVGADELAAARRALPASLDDRVTLGEPDGEGRATVHVRVPSVLPGLRLGAVTAHAGFAPQS